MNCPVCKCNGLVENTIICPQCESDLSGYILLENIKNQQGKLEEGQKVLSSEVLNEKAKKRNLTILSSALLIVCLGFMIRLYTIQSDKVIADNKAKNLSDSLIAVIEEKDTQIENLENENTNGKKENISVKYVVKRGDNLMKIARFFYNDKTRYKDIIETNNLIRKAPILIGDTLTINLND